jgi:hypothetical protein
MPSVPKFNLTVNIWRNANPVANPPDVVSRAALRIYKTAFVRGGSPGGSSAVTVVLPKGTDIRSGLSATGFDRVECPAGSGRYYIVYAVDDVGKGFPNEYRLAVISQTVQPSPLP